MITKFELANNARNLIRGAIAVMQFNLEKKNEPLNILDHLTNPLTVHLNDTYFDGVDKWLIDTVNTIKPKIDSEANKQNLKYYLPHHYYRKNKDGLSLRYTIPEMYNNSVFDECPVLNISGKSRDVYAFMIYMTDRIVDYSRFENDQFTVDNIRLMLRSLHRFVFVMIQLSTIRNNYENSCNNDRAWQVVLYMFEVFNDSIDDYQYVLELANIQLLNHSLYCNNIELIPSINMHEFSYFVLYNKAKININKHSPENGVIAKRYTLISDIN